MSVWPTCARSRRRPGRGVGGPARSAGVPRAPAAPGSPSTPARAWPRLSPRCSWPRRSPRPPGSGPGPSPRSPPSRSRRSASTCSRGSTPNRTGRPAPVRCWRTSRSASTACRSSPAAGWLRHDRSRPRRGRSSSARLWSRANGGPATTSSAHNAELRAEAERLEERTRRRDLVADDETIFAFYDARIPADVTSAAHFDTWWKQARRQDPDLLTLRWSDLTADERGPDPADFPSAWPIDGRELALDYVFEPGRPDDGVTVQLPFALLNQLDPRPFTWQVPGLRAELATELVRSLPKALRRHFVPAAEYAERALDWLAAHPPDPAESLPVALGPSVAGADRELVEGGDLDLDAGAGPPADDLRGSPRRPARRRNRSPRARTWSSCARVGGRAGPDPGCRGPRAGSHRCDVLGVRRHPRPGDGGRRPLPVVGYPALVDEGLTVGIAVLESPQRQRASHPPGSAGWCCSTRPIRPMGGRPARHAEKLALGSSPYASVPALLADARLASVGELIRRQPRAVDVRSRRRSWSCAMRCGRRTPR